MEIICDWPARRSFSAQGIGKGLDIALLLGSMIVLR